MGYINPRKFFVTLIGMNFFPTKYLEIGPKLKPNLKELDLWRNLKINCLSLHQLS